MGLESGVGTLHWLFMATLGVMLLANPVFSALVSRVRRGVFIPVTYHFFALNLVLFYLFRVVFSDQVGLVAGRVFYVWMSVFNLFAVSVFWGFMSDGFSLEQGKRLYGFIGVGGTLGAIAGAAIAQHFARPIGTPNLMLVAVVLIEMAIVCVYRLNRVFKEGVFARPVSSHGLGTCWSCGCDVGGLRGGTCPECGSCLEEEASPDRPLPVGGAFAGFRSVSRSPYFAGIGGYMLIMSVLATFMYFLQARIVEAAAVTLDERTAIFARIDFWAQVLTLVTQLFITGRLMRRLGVGVTLTMLPALAAIGFVAVAMAPSLVVLSIVQVVTRATRYAVAGPARETLFTVVAQEEKYKAKSLIDTIVPRLGDVVGALGDRAIVWMMIGAGTAGAAGATVVGATAVVPVAVAAIPIACVWAGVGVWLGAKQTALARRREEPEPRA
jgi:ATP:ADP antiporter, AAA family